MACLVHADSLRAGVRLKKGKNMREKGTGSLRKGEGGFTIIEMLVALTLLVTAMVPLAVILATSLRTTVCTSTRMMARQVGVTEIDTARSMKLVSVVINGASETFASPGPDSTTASFQIAPDAGFKGLDEGWETVIKDTQNGTQSFTVKRDVRKIASQRSATETYSYTKKVIITVSWTSPEPASSEELTTILASSDMSP